MDPLLKHTGPFENQDERTDPLPNSVENASVTQEHILKNENIHETIANFEITVLHVPYRFTQEAEGNCKIDAMCMCDWR
jgi:hypothetical protein